MNRPRRSFRRHIDDDRVIQRHFTQYLDLVQKVRMQSGIEVLRPHDGRNTDLAIQNRVSGDLILMVTHQYRKQEHAGPC